MIRPLLLFAALTQACATTSPAPVASSPAPVAIERLQVPCGKGVHEPQLAVRADGEVALAWGTRDSIRCCFGQPEETSDFFRVHSVARSLRIAVGMRRGPRVAWSGGHVILSAIGGELGGGKDGDLLTWRESELSWAEPVRVNSVAGSAREGLHAMASGPKGELFCAWIDLRSGKPRLFGAASRDTGKSWKDEGPIDPTPDVELCPCCAPSVAFDERGGVHVMWRGSREGARDLQHAVSQDGGKTFGAVRKLGTGTWKLNACPMDGGALVEVASGKVLSVWRRDKSVYLAGDDASETLLGAGEQPWIARAGDEPWVVWLERRGGKLYSLAPGAKEASVLADSANDPVIASAADGKGPVYAAWETGEGDAAEIKLVRLAKR